MATNRAEQFETEIRWTSSLIRYLRGKRTQSEFGKLLGVPKNTVWRWEAGRAVPDQRHAEALSKLAAAQRFLTDWELVGSMELLGSLEEGSKAIRASVQKSVLRSSRKLGG
ncbi:MAG: XRE family transcriptional regulator [Acidobacteria bacterium]|nr:MAG: XRE family transcriptional regulator [Acidobacteriota bacterium]